jgi:GDP-4-dehydro-6-deoxy-D-mannose reductase
MELRNATLLVTGASGFAGPWVVRALAERGAQVHATAGPGPTPSARDLPVETWHALDMRDAEGVERVVSAARPDGILHLAGQSSAARSFAEPVETFDINALGTWRLLEAVRRHAPRARVVVVTSGDIYGPQPAGTRVGESALSRPVSPYALSKAAADAFAELASTRGLDVVRARAFGHTGPGQTPEFAIPAFARQLAAIEQGAEPVLAVGNLDVVRDLSHVRDVALGYVALFERGRPGAAYNVCRGEGVRLADAVATLCGMARVPVRIEPDPARMRPADVPYLVGDPAAIAADTGWRAETPLDTTLREVLDQWRTSPTR